MYFLYPIRNFKCPFCGQRMPTETYKGWRPWTCPNCSRELQFSDTYGWIVQLVFFMAALFILYFVGLRSWALAGASVLSAFVLTVLLIGPLTRILPPRLEAYRAPPWKQETLVSVVPKESESGLDESDVGNSNGQQNGTGGSNM